MYQRTFVIGDIHGYLEVFQGLLEDIEFDPERDRLICLGDYIDGGPHSYEVVDMLIDLQDRSPIDHIFLLGNHDFMFRSTLTRLLNGVSHETLISELPEAYRDELQVTLVSYEKRSRNDWKTHLEAFFMRLPYYHLENNDLFVHAGYVPELGLEKTLDKDPKLLLTDRTMYNRACEAFDKGDPIRFGNYKTIFIGHTPTVRINEAQPRMKGNVLDLDQGIKVGGALTAWELGSGRFWQNFDR